MTTFTAPVVFRAPCPGCGQDCEWTADPQSQSRKVDGVWVVRSDPASVLGPCACQQEVPC